MKITSIKATIANFPLELSYVWSVGALPGFTRVIIEVETDAGITGIGEAPSLEHADVINNQLADKLIGEDPMDLAACELKCVPEFKILANTDNDIVLKSFGGIEIALWDLKGKALGVPLYKLLGGAVRKEIPFTEYYAFRLNGETTPKEVAEYCVKMRKEHGSTHFEGKCGTDDIDLEVELVKEVRAAIGDDATLRIDANMVWSVDAAREYLRKIEKYDISNIEDPVANFYEMEKLRMHTSIPFSTHEPDLKTAVRLGVPDNFVLNMQSLGGISRTLKFINACEEMGFGFWCYSGDTGIGSAAYLHVVAATQSINKPSQSLFRYNVDDVIEEGPFKPENNVLKVPEGPGLGVTLSQEKLKRCHERYLSEGPYNSYNNHRHTINFERLPLK